MEKGETTQFYEHLPVMESFFHVSKGHYYAPMPDDWLVGITDIKNSTRAIKNDRYKQVNILGASPIIGLLNKTSTNALPYSFGGDGCTICFPPTLLDEARAVFASSQQIGRAEYGLELRTAIIPYSAIRAEKHHIKISRFRVSQYYVQAVFSGGGLSFAEKLLKTADDGPYHIHGKDYSKAADFSGLECRWQKTSPDQKKVISLLIQCNPSITDKNKVYDEVLQKLHDIFGFDDNSNPVIEQHLKLDLSIRKLLGEAKFRTFGKGWIARLGYILKTQAQNLLGKFFMYFDWSTSATDWKLYKPDVTLNADYRKFDDQLRMVISGTPEERQQMTQFLEQMFADGKLAFGVHTASSAVITCMVFAYHHKHIHFIDGDEGGYVNASIGLKKRLQTLKKTAEPNGLA